MKASLVVFGTLSSNGISGLALFNYQIAAYFNEKNSLSKVYCLQYEEIDGIPENKVVAIQRILFFKLIFKALRYLKRIINNFPERLISEIIFDLYFSKNINFKESNVLINLKPVNPFINTVAKKQMNKVVTLATVAHPLFIKSMIRNVESKYGIVDKSSYSNKTRIKRLCSTYLSSDAIIPKVNSTFIATTFTDNGIHPDKMIKLKSNSSLDFNVYTPADPYELKDTLTFLTVGFMNLKKGIPLLIEAWVDLKNKRLLKGKLVIAGNLDSATKKSIRGFKIDENNIQLMGHVKDINETYKKADVFIASSVSDLLPKTILEALACGLPVIASSHCGSSDLVNHSSNGFIYDPFDLEKLKECMLWFENNRERLMQMRIKARESALMNKKGDFNSDFYNSCQNIFEAGKKPILK